MRCKTVRNMKEQPGRRKVNKWLFLLAVLLVPVMFFFLRSSNAAYMNSTRAQRVVAAYDMSGVLFSSNYLINAAGAENVRTVHTTDAAVGTATTLTVCNYRQGNQTKYNSDSITYRLTLRLMRYDSESNAYVEANEAYIASLADAKNAAEEEGYAPWSTADFTATVTLSNGTPLVLDSVNLSDTLESTLEGGSARSDAYSVSFGSGFTDSNLLLEAEVIPATGQELPTLRGMFRAELRAAGASNSWSGTFSDDTSVSPGNYDGFNYRISGMGSGTFTLTWNYNVLALSEVSLQMLGVTAEDIEENGGMRTVTLSVNSDNVSRYDLQFYIVSSLPEGATWENIDAYVTYSFK